MKRIFLLAALVLMVSSCAKAPKTAIVAHRGFWNCEVAGFSQNSIASLKAAQDNHFWGSEFDIQLTADDTVLVNHDGSIHGMKISEHNYADFIEYYLRNGERRPTLDEYLTQGEKSTTTKLVMELKAQDSEEREDVLLEKSLAALKAHGLFDPSRVVFISFSLHICQRIAEEAPGFMNQYLNGDIAPEQLAEMGINGWDYHYNVVEEHPEWVSQAAALGMSTNVWTVNDPKRAGEMIDLGIGAITTNEPLWVRGLLKKKENRL